MLSAYRENILILSEHVQILEQIFDSEVIRNYLYLSNLPKWVKKEELYLKEERYIWTICKYYWMGNFFGKMTGVFCFHYLSSFFFRKIKMTSTDFHVETIDRLCFVCGCIIMKSINLLENVTSNNICHSCWVQRCPLFSPLFRGVRYSEVSAIQRCPLFRGVRYSEVFILGFALIPVVPRKCVRYSEVSAISISAIAGFYCIHLWSFHRTADFCCWNHLHL